MQRQGTLVHCWWEGRLVQPLWKTVRHFLKKLKMELPFDPATPLLGIYPKNPETLLRKNICTPMFIAALFTITKVWKQPKCPPENECIKKAVVQYINTMEHHAAITNLKNLKRNFYLLWQHRWIWRLLCQWNKPVNERQLPCDLTYMWNLMNRIETVAWIHGTAWQLSEGRWEGRTEWRD